MTISLPASFSRGAVTTMTTIALVLGGAAAIAPTAFAVDQATAVADRDAEISTSTDLNWGFKASWRGYVSNPFVGGTIAASEGAEVNTDGTYTFPQAAGANYDAEARVGAVDFDGAVNFASTNHGFDIDLKNPSIALNGDSATVTAELSLAAEPEATGVSRVDVATLVVTSPEVTEDETSTTYTFGALEGTFGDSLQPGALQRYAGEAIDPVTFSIVVDKPVEDDADNDDTGNTGNTGSAGNVSFLTRILDLFRNLLNAVGGLVTSS